MLKFHMRQHDLKQGDLPEVGTHGVVLQVINCKREIDLRQMRKLKERFGISADAFA